MKQNKHTHTPRLYERRRNQHKRRGHHVGQHPQRGFPLEEAGQHQPAAEHVHGRQQRAQDLVPQEVPPYVEGIVAVVGEDERVGQSVPSVSGSGRGRAAAAGRLVREQLLIVVRTVGKLERMK